SPSRSESRLLQSIVVVLIGAVAGFVALAIPPGIMLAFDGWTPVLFLCAMGVAGVLMIWGMIFVHELGHLCAAIMTGLRVFEFKAVPLQIIRVRRSFRLSYNRTTWRPPWGLVRVLVDDETHRLRTRFAIVTIAGPIASVTAGMATLVVIVLT